MKENLVYGNNSRIPAFRDCDLRDASFFFLLYVEVPLTSQRYIEQEFATSRKKSHAIVVRVRRARGRAIATTVNRQKDWGAACHRRKSDRPMMYSVMEIRRHSR